MTMNQIETKKIILNFMSSFFVQAKIKTEPQMSMQFVVFSLGRAGQLVLMGNDVKLIRPWNFFIIIVLLQLVLRGNDVKLIRPWNFFIIIVLHSMTNNYRFISAWLVEQVDNDATDIIFDINASFFFMVHDNFCNFPSHILLFRF